MQRFYVCIYCKMITTIKQLTHPSPYIITISCVYDQGLIYSLGNSQICITVLLTIDAMLYIIVPDGTHLITGSLYPLIVFTDSLPTSHPQKLPVYSDFFFFHSPDSHILLLLLYSCCVLWISQVALVVKNLPANAGDGGELGSIPVVKIPWRRAQQPTPESHGQRSLVSYSSQGCKELGTTEVTQHACMHYVLYFFKKVLSFLGQFPF